MKPVISVVTGTFNRLALLQQFYASCHQSVPVGIEVEYIFVDGGSTDGTQEWCKSKRDIVLIEHGELLGAIKAFDDGAYAAQGKFVLLANDDIEIRGDSLTRALMHMEENPTCGGLAFYDDRSNPWTKGLHVWQMPAMRNGANVTVDWAQVGLFRKWLGDKVGWWGSRDETFTAKTYAGDNLLSARIWELGYTIDKVDGVSIHDLVFEDELRQINRGDPSTQEGGHPDSAAYYKLYPVGPTIPDRPKVDNPDKTQLRVLYLPIYEQDRGADGEYTPRCRLQHEQKCGLRKALQRKGALVYEVDYLKYYREPERLFAGLMQVLDLFQPHMILTQIHGTDVLNADIMSAIRGKCPRAFIANWNGDVYPAALKSKPMLALLNFIDLQLVVNAGVIPWYEQHGIRCAYWQCAAEEPEGELPDVPEWDVLFLGSNYSEYRHQFGDFLRSLGIPRLGLYGLNWGADGNPDCTYDFLTGTALYRNARIALGENQYLENTAFVSNRLFECLDAGGALLLHQTVNGLETHTGLKAGEHYIAWKDYDELAEQIKFWLDPANEKKRKKIVRAAQKFVRENHSFDARVRELFGDKERGMPALLELAKRKLTNTVALQYIGRADSAGGVLGRATGRNYVHEAGKLLVVDVLDAPEILREFPTLFKEMGVGQGDRVAEAVEGMR